MFAKLKQQFFLWDGQPVTQNFEITVDLPVQACVDRVETLERCYAGTWDPISPDVDIREMDDTAYSFELRIIRDDYDWPYTSVKCTGVIFRDSSDQTVIKGQLAPSRGMVGTWAVFLGTAVTAFFVNPNALILPVVAGFFGLIAVLQFWVDYRKLRTQIYQAFQPS